MEPQNASKIKIFTILQAAALRRPEGAVYLFAASAFSKGVYGRSWASATAL
jgi:hypothetical protein